MRDTDTDAVYGVDTEGIDSGLKKWTSITPVGTKLYTAPYYASVVLVLDGPLCARVESSLSHAFCFFGTG